MSHATGPHLSLEVLRQLATQPELARSNVLALLSTLGSQDEEVRAWASDCLEQVEQPSIETLPQLGLLCLDRSPPIASWACKLLGRIGERACQDALIRALGEHPSIGVRQQAALALARLPELDAKAVEALTVAARSDDQRLQRIARTELETLR